MEEADAHQNAAQWQERKRHSSRVTELPKITTTTDTREILAHAAKEARQDNYFIVDVDAHVTETAFWPDVIDRMESDVYKQMARAFKDRGPAPGLLNSTPGMLYQDVFGRIPHQQRLAEAVPGGRTHAQVTLVQRAMDFTRHRLHGGVSHPDAGARHASAARDRGGRSATPSTNG